MVHYLGGELKHLLGTVLPVILATFIPIVAKGDIPSPKPVDQRCGRFVSSRAVIFLAYPLVLDTTMDGSLEETKWMVAKTISDDLSTSSMFLIRKTTPMMFIPTWFSDIAFDYIGWREAGVYMVIVVEISFGTTETLEIKMHAFLTEEGDEIDIRDSVAVLKPSEISGFLHRWTNALMWCLTGRSGIAGTRIAFAKRTKEKKGKEIYYVEFGSDKQIQISFDGDTAILPTWAPNQRIAYTGYKRGNPDLYINGQILCSRAGLNMGAAFSPDGKYLAITQEEEGNIDIYLVQPDTCKQVARLTNHPGIDTSPSWSPDGKKIAFVSDRNGGPQIFVMEWDGRDQRPLPLPGSYNTSPDWSPDGREIAYQSRGEGAQFSIWVYDLTRGIIKRLTAGPWADEEPSFSPDGSMIVFTSTRKGRKLLYVMDRDGGNQRPILTDEGEYFTPAWEKMFFEESK